MFIFNPVNTEVVNINRRLDVCVALVKIKFQKNNIGVISVFGISLVFYNTIWYLVFQILFLQYLYFSISNTQMWVFCPPLTRRHAIALKLDVASELSDITCFSSLGRCLEATYVDDDRKELCIKIIEASLLHSQRGVSALGCRLHRPRDDRRSQIVT